MRYMGVHPFCSSIHGKRMDESVQLESWAYPLRLGHGHYINGATVSPRDDRPTLCFRINSISQSWLWTVLADQRSFPIDESAHRVAIQPASRCLWLGFFISSPTKCVFFASSMTARTSWLQIDIHHQNLQTNVSIILYQGAGWYFR